MVFLLHLLVEFAPKTGCQNKVCVHCCPFLSADDEPSLVPILNEHLESRQIVGLHAALNWVQLKDADSVTLIRVSEAKQGTDLTKLMQVTAGKGLSSLTIRFKAAAYNFGAGNKVIVTIPKAALVEAFNKEDLILSVSTDIPDLPNK